MFGRGSEMETLIDRVSGIPLEERVRELERSRERFGARERDRRDKKRDEVTKRERKTTRLNRHVGIDSEIERENQKHR